MVAQAAVAGGGAPSSTCRGRPDLRRAVRGAMSLGFLQVRSVVLSEIGTYEVLDAALGGYRVGRHGLAVGLTGGDRPGDLMIPDRPAILSPMSGG
ncbi:hypothetical protein GCM10022214_13720 [Actinomadura miaoliensis]|uniref:Uncharacterized protein n=1 Tax=Actinomadura miaoliensis TaxID=430685 RepID=A0ABP7V8N1_9ACTN